MTDQPAEATQPRLWLGTVTWAHGATEHDVPLWGFDPEWGYTAPTRDAYFTPAQVTDLRPVVVVPQQEDGGEVERLAEVAYSAAWDAVSGKGDPWEDADPCTREDYRGVVRAVLAAQRPTADVSGRVTPGLTQAAPVGDEPWAIYEAREGIVWTVHPPTQANAEREAAGFMDARDEAVLGPHGAMPKAFADQLANAWRTGRHAGIDRHKADSLAAPVAVDEATVARVLVGHVALRGDGGRITCLGCDWEGRDYPDFAAHQAAEVVRALAARDGGAS